MKKINFLLKIFKEGKLEIVEPSDELSQSYLEKSESNFDSAKILLNANKLEESVSLAYFGMYNCLLSLLFKCGVKSENHSASILILRELYKEEKLAKIISSGKKERIDKQYYANFKLSKLDTKDMPEMSENFIVECRNIIK